MTKTKPFNTIFTKPTPVTCCCCDSVNEKQSGSEISEVDGCGADVVRKVVGWLVLSYSGRFLSSWTHMKQS